MSKLVDEKFSDTMEDSLYVFTPLPNKVSLLTYLPRQSLHQDYIKSSTGKKTTLAKYLPSQVSRSKEEKKKK